jgi:hypothetical protein
MSGNIRDLDRQIDGWIWFSVRLFVGPEGARKVPQCAPKVAMATYFDTAFANQRSIPPHLLYECQCSCSHYRHTYPTSCRGNAGLCVMMETCRSTEQGADRAGAEDS